MFQLAESFLRSGVGLVIESNFSRGMDEGNLQPLVELSSAALVHCYAPPEVALRRYEERFREGQRQPVHFDEDTITAAHADGLEAWERFFAGPLDLPIPTLVLDTTEAFVTDIEPIITFIRESTSRPNG